MHRTEKCPAQGQVCLKCKKKNHFASVCKATAKPKVHEVIEQRLSDVSEDLFIDEIRIDSCESDDDVVWMTEVKVNDTMVNFKIDTGAHVNVIPLLTPYSNWEW